MYRVTLVLGLLLGGAVASPLFGKEEPDPDITCTTDGNFAMPGQCGPDYYVCVGGTAYPQSCPGGAIFDPVALKCVLPGSASCLTTAPATTTTTPRITSTWAPMTTSTQFTCPSDGNFAVPGQCSGSYYLCIGGDAYIQSCPGTAIFDPEQKRCVTNGTASCQISSTTSVATTTEAPTTTLPPFNCPSDGNFAIPGQCSGSYYLCIGGNAYMQSCAGTTIFDPELKRCVTNGTASCQISTTTSAATTTVATTTSAATTTVATTTSAATTTVAPTTTLPPFNCPSDGNFAIPGQCSGTYYVCVDGVPYFNNCPGTTIFDPVLRRCVTNGTASCQVSTTTVAATTTMAPTTTTTAPFTCPGDGNYAIPGQCSGNYYVCVDGEAYSGSCPGTTIFDPVLRRCVTNGTASCQGTTTPSVSTTTVTSTTTAATTTTPAPFVCTQDGNFPVPGQCTATYYICIDGVRYDGLCPGLTIFDPETFKCTSPDIVSCLATTSGSSTTIQLSSTTSTSTTSPLTSTTIQSTSTTTLSTTSPFISTTVQSTTNTPSTTSPFMSTTTQKPFTCGNDGNYAVPGQCVSQYYICIGGEAYVANCPNNNIFDPVTLRCVTPESASCTATTTPGSSTTTTPSTTITTTTQGTSTTTPSTTITSTAASTSSPLISTTTSTPFTCGADGNYAIPGQCTSQYYICISGTLYFGNCPGNNIFDPVMLRCVAPETASCFGTTTPVQTTSTIGSTTTQGPFSCPAQEGNFPIPGQCGSNYYICVSGIPYPAACPGTSIFDPSTLTCVSADVASCRNTTTTPSSSTVTSTSASTTTSPSTQTSSTTTAATTTTANSGTGSTTTGPFVCPAPNGLFANPDPTKCNTYYQCSNNNPTLMFCTPPLVFNAVFGQCDWQYNVPDCKVEIDETVFWH